MLIIMSDDSTETGTNEEKIMASKSTKEVEKVRISGCRSQEIRMIFDCKQMTSNVLDCHYHPFVQRYLLRC